MNAVANLYKTCYLNFFWFIIFTQFIVAKMVSKFYSLYSMVHAVQFISGFFRFKKKILNTINWDILAMRKVLSKYRLLSP